MNKDETSSPTVMTESVMLSCIIDAKEGQDVATADIPGAFMQADLEETVHIWLEGPMVDLMAKIDPKLYWKYIKDSNGKSVMYAELEKALYGTLQASLLFWKKLSKSLIEWGFETNPYDWCVVNKVINGKQCMVLWHVDNLKVSHIDTRVVDGVLKQINDAYGKEVPITITRGKVHDYLGMTLDFSDEGKVKITLYNYIKKMLAELPPDMTGEAPTPAGGETEI